MTDRINPITDILKRLLADVDDNMEFIGTTWNSKEHASSSVSKSLDASLQALYEAVKGCVPEEVADNIGSSTSDYEWGNRGGFNMAIEQVLTNLSLLFGVADVGSSQDKTTPTAQGHEADNLSEEANP